MHTETLRTSLQAVKNKVPRKPLAFGALFVGTVETESGLEYLPEASWLNVLELRCPRW